MKNDLRLHCDKLVDGKNKAVEETHSFLALGLIFSKFTTLKFTYFS